MTAGDPAATAASRIVFVGGGNMAFAILGGLIREGAPASAFIVVEPDPAQRQRLRTGLGLEALPAAGPELTKATMTVWAVKPQAFAEAAAPCRDHVQAALQLSIMAGVRCAAIERATGSARIVRAMPNTPALIGKGVSALFATPAVRADERLAAEKVLAATGSLLWVERESDLDAVTALSGSGPACVFYFIEAMVQAGVEMGLEADQARRLAQETFAGAAALAMQSAETPEQLRQRVTSRGGTTHAAISALEAAGVKATFVRALHAARTRAEELGQ